MEKPLLFATESYQPLAGEVLRLGEGRIETGSVERRLFPDGERYLRIENEVYDRNVVILSGTPTDGETLDIYDMASAITKYGARCLLLLIPYFGYSTMERATRPGEVVTAKNRARLLSSMPSSSEGNRVFLLDLHSPGITHYFEGNIRSFHIELDELIAGWVKELGWKDAILASTDAGRAKYVQHLADRLGREAAFVYKRRVSGSSSMVVGVNADVTDRDVIIYDDMIRTGGSLLNAARIYRQHGARRLMAVTTHLVLPGNALGGLRDSGLFQRIVGTDSHPRSWQLLPDHRGFLEVRSLAPTLVSMILDDKTTG